MKINDVIMTNQDVEVSPLHVIPKSMFGKVLDFTVPNYVLVRFANGECEWVDEKYITKVK